MIRILKEETSIPSEVQEFVNKIDWKGLNDHVSNLIGTNVDLSISRVSSSRSGSEYYIDVTETDVLKDCGVFSYVLKECVVDTFGSTVSRDKETKQLRYWCSPHLSYKHKDGGMNGMSICRAWWDGTKWTFRDLSDN